MQRNILPIKQISKTRVFHPWRTISTNYRRCISYQFQFVHFPCFIKSIVPMYVCTIDGQYQGDIRFILQVSGSYIDKMGSYQSYKNLSSLDCVNHNLLVNKLTHNFSSANHHSQFHGKLFNKQIIIHESLWHIGNNQLPLLTEFLYS